MLITLTNEELTRAISLYLRANASVAVDDVKISRKGNGHIAEVEASVIEATALSEVTPVVVEEFTQLELPLEHSPEQSEDFQCSDSASMEDPEFQVTDVASIEPEEVTAPVEVTPEFTAAELVEQEIAKMDEPDVVVEEESSHYEMPDIAQLSIADMFKASI